MRTRTHRYRVLEELRQVREELLATAKRIPPERLSWAPCTGMKTCRDLLREVGTMEKICREWAAHGNELPWDSAVEWSGDDLKSTLRDLQDIRAETLACLECATDEGLETQIPALWGDFLGAPAIEREEMLRWMGRHEYYHLGQLNTYLWIMGDNPYERN